MLDFSPSSFWSSASFVPQTFYGCSSCGIFLMEFRDNVRLSDEVNARDSEPEQNFFFFLYFVSASEQM